MIQILDQANRDKAPAPPASWRWVRLGEVVREAQGGFAAGDRDPDGVIQLRMNNVTTRGQFDWSSYLRVPKREDLLTKYSLEPGDVLFNNTNSTELVGKSALFNGYDEPVVFSNHFTRLRVVEDRLLPNFLALLLQHYWQERLFASICNRWVGQSAVQRDKLLALEVPLPPLPEQRRIAARLTEQMAAVERAWVAARLQVEATQELPAAYSRSIFNRPNSARWPTARVGDVAAVSGGIQKSPGRAPRTFHRPFLTVRNVQRGHLDLSNVERFEVTPAELDRLRLLPGDVLIVEGNGSVDQIGRNALFSGELEDCVHQNHLIRVRADRTRIEPRFLSVFLNSDQGKAQMVDKARTTSGLYTLSVSKVEQLEVPVPPLTVQREVIAILGEQTAVADTVRRLVREQYAATERLPAALLRQAFAGEV